MLHTKTVAPQLLAVLSRIMSLQELQSFRLVGGTALALQIGHRNSVDIDLFTDAPFDSKALRQCLIETFPSFQLTWQNDNGFSSIVDGIKLDIFNWRVRFLEPPLTVDGIRMLNPKEIAAMKLEAITDRKEKKDFIDLVSLLQLFPLKTMIETFRAKYLFIDYKFAIESLLAIDKADNTELPLMLQAFDWNQAKRIITQAVQQFVAEKQTIAQLQQAKRLENAEEILRNKKNKDSCLPNE